MSGSITWRSGASGAWSSPIDWNEYRLPGTADGVTIGSNGMVTIESGFLAGIASLALPGGTLVLAPGSTLEAAGTIATAGGTLQIGGTVEGGTLVPGGTVVGDGGTLDGTVVQGGLAGIGDVTVTAATVAANAAAPVAPTGTLTLAAGVYQNASFQLSPVQGAELDAAGTGVVVLGAGTQIVANTGTATTDSVTVLGGGTLANRGTISLDPAVTGENEIVYEPTGKFHSLVPTVLSWTQSAAPTLEVTAEAFVNTNLIAIVGGTIDFSGATARNSGSIRLADTTGQTATQAPNGIVSVETVTLATSVDVAASVDDFRNTGTITADSISFANSIGLGALGTLVGALAFSGTLDLGGGTLSATATAPVTITGTVAHGTLAQAGGAQAGGALALSGATLQDVMLGAGTAAASGTLDAPVHGGLTIASGAELQVASTATIDGAAGGVVNDGTIDAAANATLIMQAGLDGDGTVELGANAAVSITSLALQSQPTFLFDAGAAFLSLPGTEAGITLADLHAGDVLDLTAISGGAQATAQIAGGTLEVGGGGSTAMFSLFSPAQNIAFTTASDGHTGTLLTVT